MLKDISPLMKPNVMILLLSDVGLLNITRNAGSALVVGVYCNFQLCVGAAFSLEKVEWYSVFFLHRLFIKFQNTRSVLLLFFCK